MIGSDEIKNYFKSKQKKSTGNKTTREEDLINQFKAKEKDKSNLDVIENTSKKSSEILDQNEKKIIKGNVEISSKNVSKEYYEILFKNYQNKDIYLKVKDFVFYEDLLEEEKQKIRKKDYDILVAKEREKKQIEVIKTEFPKKVEDI